MLLTPYASEKKIEEYYIVQAKRYTRRFTLNDMIHSKAADPYIIFDNVGLDLIGSSAQMLFSPCLEKKV